VRLEPSADETAQFPNNPWSELFEAEGPLLVKLRDGTSFQFGSRLLTPTNVMIIGFNDSDADISAAVGCPQSIDAVFKASTDADTENRAETEVKIEIVTDDGRMKLSTSTVPPVTPEFWGITKKQIREFYNKYRLHPDWMSMNARDMVKEIINRDFSKTSVALSFNHKEPIPIEHLFSHCWDENINEFLLDVLSSPVEEDVGVFICFFSLYQGSEDEIDLQVTQGSGNILDGCFAKVLNAVKDHKGSMTVVPNEVLKETGSGLYSRLWCSWEVYNAYAFEIPIQVWPPYKCNPQYLFGSGGITTFTSQSGHCGPPDENGVYPINKDEILISNAVMSDCGWEQIDQILISVSQEHLERK
jgi:hypothetical protein